MVTVRRVSGDGNCYIIADFKRLSEDHPDWVKPYEIPKLGSRRFLVQVGK